MNRNNVIRQLVLCCVFAAALLRSAPAVADPAVADLCTDVGLPATTKATFPGFAATQGGNRYAPGSPGGTCTSSTSTSCTYRVNSLAPSGFGTLADAVSQSNRYIVFDVPGTITLKQGIMVTGANLTIDGCSAPSPGITLTGAGLYIHGALDPYPLCTGGCNVHDIIVRNLRARSTIDDGFRVAYGAY